MTRDSAEILALHALAWLLAHEDLGPVFLGATGSDAADLRARADAPETLISVLDFLMMDDAWVCAFCDGQGQPYDAPMRARAALPGGETVHWT